MIDAPVVFDLTGLAVSVVGGIFSVLGIVLTAVINSRMKDTQAAATLGAAVKNALGVMQEVSTGAIVALHPSVGLPGVTPEMGTGIQYVMDHAGAEAARFGITQEAIAEKIQAQLGLQSLAVSNVPLAARLVAPKTIPLAPVIPYR